MIPENGSKVEKLASNAVFTVAGRGAMLLAVPILIWMGSTLVGIQLEVAVLKSTVELGASDRYRGADAIRDSRLVQNQIDDLKRRVEVLERQVPGSTTRTR